MAAMIEIHHWSPIVPKIASTSLVWIQIPSWISLSLPVSSVIFMPKFLLSQIIACFILGQPLSCLWESHVPFSPSSLQQLAHVLSGSLLFLWVAVWAPLLPGCFHHHLRHELVAPSVCCHVKSCQMIDFSTAIILEWNHPTCICVPDHTVGPSSSDCVWILALSPHSAWWLYYSSLR